MEHWDIFQRRYVTTQVVTFNSKCSTCYACQLFHGQSPTPCVRLARGLHGVCLKLKVVRKPGWAQVNSDMVWKDEAELCLITAGSTVVIKWNRNVLGSKTKGLSWKNGKWEGLGVNKEQDGNEIWNWTKRPSFHHFYLYHLRKIFVLLLPVKLVGRRHSVDTTLY